MSRYRFKPASDFYLRSFVVRITAIVLLVVWSCRAVAQIDSDPTNDMQATGDDLGLLPGFAASNRATLAAPGGDVDFFTVQLSEEDVAFGMTTPIASLPSGFEGPDTMASVFAFGSQATFSDDDDADELPSTGGALGSLFRFQAELPSTYYVGITGFGDDEFDGAGSGNSHSETGDYIITAAVVTPSVLGGGFSDTDPANDALSGADTIPSAPGAHVSVLEMMENDVDFFTLTLSAGQVLSAITAPLDDLPNWFDFPDTVLGLFDSAGTLLLVNDDAGLEVPEPVPGVRSDNPFFEDEGIFGSAFRAVIPSDGVYYLGVTGFEDDDFVGNHVEFGRYALLLGVAGDEEPPMLAGDFNADGIVDAADYVVWRKNEGTLYDQDDYNDWRTNFGRTIDDPEGSSLSSVPEPAIAAMFAIFALFASTLRKRLA